MLLVGHEPCLSLLIGWIVAGSEDARVVLHQGSLAKIRDLAFAPVSGELEWLVMPELLQARDP